MAAETLVPVDVEVEVSDELNARMPALGHNVAAAPSIPEAPPAEFIRIVAVGGTEETLVTDAHTFTVEGFATSETKAQRLCAFALAALQAAGRDGRIGTAAASRVRVASLPQNLPQPSLPDRYRFTATLSASLRRVAV